MKEHLMFFICWSVIAGSTFISNEHFRWRIILNPKELIWSCSRLLLGRRGQKSHTWWRSWGLNNHLFFPLIRWLRVVMPLRNSPNVWSKDEESIGQALRPGKILGSLTYPAADQPTCEVQTPSHLDSWSWTAEPCLMDLALLPAMTREQLGKA